MTPFIIICAARTGSTMLRLYLHQHPEICCHGEVFIRDEKLLGACGIDGEVRSNIAEYLASWKRRDRRSFLEEVVFFPGSFQAVGVKIKYSEWAHPDSAPMLKWVQSNPQVAIIHLTRRNPFRRYLSHLVATRTGVNVVLKGRERPQAVRLSVDYEDCIREVQTIREEEARFRLAFSENRTLEVTYEDLVDPGSDSRERVQRFLGVAPKEIEFRTEKLGVDDLSEVVENLSELRRLAEGTPHRDLFY